MAAALRHFGVDVRFAWLANVEHNFVSQQFLRIRDRESLLVADAQDLGDLEALDTPDLVLGGVECGARSALNPARRRNVHCVWKGDSGTGRTFAYLHRYIVEHNIPVCLIENSANFAIKGRASEDSVDLSPWAAATTVFSEAQYAGTCRTLKAGQQMFLAEASTPRGGIGAASA